MNLRPTYSICMCNYNMADTIERSLTSLLTQLDDRFEVVFIDDGSNDGSVAVVEEMRQKYPNLRLVALPRDRKRKLGLTRNISISEAQGDYVLLHLDCDDVFGPHVAHFVEVFHRIESCLGRDILLCGQHINMAKREFLLRNGPYRNIYRGEDRDLLQRMAAIDAYIALDHVDFIRRLPKTRAKRHVNAVINTFDHLRNDFRSSSSARDALHDEWSRWPQMRLRLRIFRFLLLLPAWIVSLREERIPLALSHDAFASYRERIRGTYPEIMSRHGCNSSLSFLGDNDAEHVFKTKQGDI